MSTVTCIGIDLAWSSNRNHSGAVVLRGDRDGAALVAVAEPIHSLDEVTHFVKTHTPSRAVVAIDAPLIIENATGQRPCENAVGRAYGAREASCHPANRRLYPDAGSVRLAADLQKAGFVHAPVATAHSHRVMLEVYPHAGLVALFDLPKTLKYKKGALSQKRQGLTSLAAHLQLLTRATPRLHQNEELDGLLGRSLEPLRGAELKMHEDRLDALVCAYIALYQWYWGSERTQVFGDAETGYIVNPRLVPGGIVSHAG